MNWVILLDISTGTIIKIQLSEAMRSEMECYDSFEAYAVDFLEKKYHFRCSDCSWMVVDTLHEVSYLQIAEKESKDKYPPKKRICPLDEPVSGQFISRRLMNIAQDEGWETLEDLVRLRREDFFKIRKLGKGTYLEIQKLVEKKGLALGLGEEMINKVRRDYGDTVI